MPRRCTVCAHEQREAIDVLIVRNATFRDIARRFGLDHEAIGRHARNHMPPPEPAPSLADLERARQAEHREHLRIEKRHVLAGLLRVIQTAEVGAATVSAWREIARLEGHYPPKDIRVEHFAALDRLSHQDVNELLAIEDDTELLAALEARGVRMNGDGPAFLVR